MGHTPKGKPSPGPWRLGADGRRIWALKEKLVAEVPGWGIYQGKVDKANAYLITRAPEMQQRIEELEAINSQLREACERAGRRLELSAAAFRGFHHPLNAELCDDEAKSLEAAIKKGSKIA